MPSENSVMANFGEFPFRDCPKRVGGACGVTLRSTSTVLFDPFWPPCASQIHAHSVALTPFRTVSEREFSEVQHSPVPIGPGPPRGCPCNSPLAICVRSHKQTLHRSDAKREFREAATRVCEGLGHRPGPMRLGFIFHALR